MKKTFLLVLMCLSVFAFAQKLSLVSGSFDALKNQNQINTIIVFDQVKIYVENMSETEYLAKREREIKADKGRSQEYLSMWMNEWEKHKNEVYLAKFLNGLEKTKKIKFVGNQETPLTLLVNTEWIFPGWHGGVIMQPAKLTTLMTFVETANPEKVVLQLKGEMIQGTKGGKDLIMEYGRIASSYQKTGKLLRKEIDKNL